jgi:regulator of sirC expression with transglutaminase-like and TPR domain
MAALVQEFALELKQAIPERLALMIARLAYPDLELAPYLGQLDEMAAVVAARAYAAPPGELRAAALLDAVRSDLGFRGDEERYYAPENSFLNRVLERRRGLPIMLSLVCMALARRAGLRVDGMGFPGHFMARYEDGVTSRLLDPFHGAVIAPEEAAAYLSALYQRPIELPGDATTPVEPIALALRILNNLRNVYRGANDLAAAMRVVGLMLVAAPDNALLWQEHGLLAYQLDDPTTAGRSLRRYFFLNGGLALTYPQWRGAQGGGEPMTQADRRLLAILHELDAGRGRYN